MNFKVTILNPTVPDNVKYFETLEELQDFTRSIEFPYRQQFLKGTEWHNIEE